jgi:outer membrane protein TolC
MDHARSLDQGRGSIQRFLSDRSGQRKELLFPPAGHAPKVGRTLVALFYIKTYNLRFPRRLVVSDRDRRLLHRGLAAGLKGACLIAAGLLSLPNLAAQTTPGASPGTPGSPFAGSVASEPVAGVLRLSLQDAIDRGLRQNLGALLSSSDVQSARGQRWEQLSALLPHVVASPYVDVSKSNLSEVGFSFRAPGLTFPTSVGPFSYFDARVNVTQSLLDWKAISNARAAGQSLKSSRYTYKDARDLVVLAVGFSYLQAVSDQARIETAEAQVKSAQAIYNRASDQVNAGTSPAIDGLRAKVELQTRQQQLIQARNDFAIQNLAVGRVIGLAPGQEFELTDQALYQPFEGPSVEECLRRAYSTRSDYQAAMAEVSAAEFSRHAAVAGYFPSLSFSGDIGKGGQHPSTATQVFDVRGTLSIPIFQGGSVHGSVLQADAKLTQSRERLANLRGEIDSEVRTALLNLQSSAEQVEVARSNIELAEAALTQSTDRFSAGVADTVEVVQAQQTVASAHEQYIASLYSYNYAKISLARSLGSAETTVKEFFKGK